ncbi:MAG: hypothetical protein QM784_28475 [Polyangiaceae bacterium]
MTIRLSNEPRAVELEIASPLGTHLRGPLDEALTDARTRALGTVSYATSSHHVLRTKLVGMDGAALDDTSIGRVLEALRARLITPSYPRVAGGHRALDEFSRDGAPHARSGSHCDRAA